MAGGVVAGDSSVQRGGVLTGLVPGSRVEVVAVEPFSGPITVRTDQGERAISRELALSVNAEPTGVGSLGA